MDSSIWTLRFLGVGLLLRMEIAIPFAFGPDFLVCTTIALLALVNFYVEKLYQSTRLYSAQWKILVVGAAMYIAIILLYLAVGYSRYWIDDGIDWQRVWDTMLFMCYLWFVMSFLHCTMAWIDARAFRARPKV